MVFLCTLNLLTNFINFSLFFRKLFVDITLLIWCFFLVRIISSYCFMTSAASSAFSTLSAFSFSSSVLIILWLQLFFIEPPCLLGVFRTSPQLQTKNNRYTINLKHPLQTKIPMSNLILRLSATPLGTKRVLLYMIKGCKSTLSQAFSQSGFSDQPYQKKILESFC